MPLLFLVFVHRCKLIYYVYKVIMIKIKTKPPESCYLNLIEDLFLFKTLR